MTVTLLQGDALEQLKTLPDGCVQTVVTSPPYYGLRDYGTAKWEGGDPECDHKRGTFQSNKTTLHPGTSQNDKRNNDGMPYGEVCGRCGATRIDAQIGLEQTPGAYIEKLVAVFREVRRVLKDDGTLWVNIGDSYAHSQPGRNRNGNGGQIVRGELYRSKNNTGSSEMGKALHDAGYKDKDLLGIPWMLAFALRADGWYLRQDIIWHKPNPMPESVTDRCTKSHEYIFLLAKSQRYYYDAEAVKENGVSNRPDMAEKGVRTGLAYLQQGKHPSNSKYSFARKVNESPPPGKTNQHRADREDVEYSGTRNRRSVWTVTTKPYKEAHFATFPPDLIEPCILAGTSERGECPKCGKAWVRETEVSYIQHRKRGKWEERLQNEAGENRSPGMSKYGVASKAATTLGWRPQCDHYPRVDEWEEYIKPRGEKPTPEEDAENERIAAVRSTLLQLWEYETAIPQTVLDPFNGSGTTGAVSLKHGRNYIGIELNPEYLKLTEKRLATVQPLMVTT